MSKLTKKLDVRITEDEYREVHKQRDCFGFTTLSDLLRGHIKTGICYRIDFDKLSEVAKEISIIGDKVNQISATVNSTLVVTKEQIKTLNSYMQELDDIMNYDIKDMINISVCNARENKKKK